MLKSRLVQENWNLFYANWIISFSIARIIRYMNGCQWRKSTRRNVHIDCMGKVVLIIVFMYDVPLVEFVDLVFTCLPDELL